MLKKTLPLLLSLLFGRQLQAQETFPVNGVADGREKCYAFTNATIVKESGTTLTNATLVIRDGKIVAVGSQGVALPKDAVVIDCKDKYIYPSFIDIYTDYGIPGTQRDPAALRAAFNFNAPSQITSNTKGAYGWNQAIRPETDAARIFVADDGKAKVWRELGFGTVLTHSKDGIARGSGAVVTLASERENSVIVKDRAAAHYSFNKGSSQQSYPSSIMGSIALLRQTYLDAQWYKNNAAREGLNHSLKAWNELQGLPQIFEAEDKWNDVRAAKIAAEFGVKYIIKGGGNEYQRIADIAALQSPMILTLNFPAAMDVEDPIDARAVSVADMKHWEMAPGNPAALEKAGISFCLTVADLRDPKTFYSNLRKAIEAGLSENKAMDALTKTPASLLGIYDKVGSLEAGKLANFIITSGPVFAEKTTILQNWVQGNKYGVKEDAWSDVKGVYALTITGEGGTSNYTLDVKSAAAANVIGKDTLTGKFSHDGKLVKLSFATQPPRRAGGGGMGRVPATYRLSGVANGNTWNGMGEDTAGNKVTWTATWTGAAATAAGSDSSRRRPSFAGRTGKVQYPFNGYGWEEAPKQENILIKNATVWTNEKEGKLEGADVLIKNGKIVKVGKNLREDGVRIIDATGKHVTAGVIDEHSHIAAASINEGGQSVTSEARIADNLNPEDINI